MKATDPSRSRVKRAPCLLRTVGTRRDWNVYGSNGLDAHTAILLLKILNPVPKKRTR